jgi:hypothetical protein
MSIASNLQAIASSLSGVLSAINTKLTAKGSTAADTLDEVAGKINAIPTGGITPTGTKSITENGTYDVTEFASASVAVPEPSGTKTITTNGTHDVAAYASATVNVPTENPPSGTVNITANGTVDVTNYASAAVAVPTGTARSSSDLTASGATVTVPAGLYSSQASKTVSTATQATPSISVNTSTGVITASATQSAGYVSAGTKSATQSLTTQAAQTITPGTSDQTIASGRYLTGTQTIKGDSDLKASNIKSGVTIFNVTGSYEGSVELESSNTYVVNTRTGARAITFSGFSVPSGYTLIGVAATTNAYDVATNHQIETFVVFTSAYGGLGFVTQYGNLGTMDATSALTLTVSGGGGSVTISSSSSMTFSEEEYNFKPIFAVS